MIVDVLNTVEHQSHGSCAEKGQEKEKADPHLENTNYDREWGMSMGFPRQEYWSVLPFPPLGDLSDPGMESVSPACQTDSLPLSHLEAQSA